MRIFTNFRVAKPVRVTLILLIAPFLGSCVMTEGYYGDSGGSYYGEPGYASSYRNYGHGSSYDRRYYRDDDYNRYDSRRYEQQNYRQRDSRDYHRDRNHAHQQTTTSDKIRLVNYREDKKKSHPSGYHDADYWKSRGYSVKKNTFEKKDGKIVGSRKNLKNSRRH